MYRASQDGKLSDEELRMITNYTNAMGPGKDATKQWEELVKLLPPEKPKN